MEAPEAIPQTELPTPQRSTYPGSMMLLGILYLLAALDLFFLPGLFLTPLNWLAEIIPGVEPAPDTAEGFWRLLASCYLLVLSASAFFAAKAPRVVGFPLLQLLAHGAATCGFTYLFWKDQPLITTLVGGLAGGFLFLTIFWKTFFSDRLSS